MSQFRYDWFSDRWVIFAPHRSHRPDEYSSSQETCVPQHDCPFCAGNEAETPIAVLLLPSQSTGAKSKSDNSVETTDQEWKISRNKLPTRRPSRIAPPNWKVRVVPNKFPALKTVEEDLFAAGIPAEISYASSHARGSRKKQSRNVPNSLPSEMRELAIGLQTDTFLSIPQETEPSYELFQSGDFHGAHEVFIECGEHLHSLTQLSTDHVRLIIEAYQHRLRYHRKQAGLRYAVVFKNSGPAAGATLSHLHSQLIATSFMPTEILRLGERWQHFGQRHGICPVCSMIDREIADGSRIVWESEQLVAICPYASRSPYSLSIFPKNHQSQFESDHHSWSEELAKYLLRTLKAMENAMPNVSYNYVIHTSPFREGFGELFHWRIDLFPRLGKMAGFEWGSGSHINSVLPEEAARTFRLYFATSEIES
jgi:UDPglucose--hexose-1-phosphate uridylyltransferase